LIPHRKLDAWRTLRALAFSQSGTIRERTPVISA